MSTEASGSSSLKPRASRRDSQRSSMFGRARMSFYRSGGQRGATLEELRGTSGADFEGKCDIERGHSAASASVCFCFGGVGGGSDKNATVLIKGPFCFVFSSETAKAPKYAISLAYMSARVQEASSGKHPVWLETNLGDVEYELVFDGSQAAETFCTAANAQAAAGQADEVRKRLGHEHLLVKRASVRYAESVANQKVENQPEAPVSAEELMANVIPQGTF